jgi:hypothetical protein
LADDALVDTEEKRISGEAVPELSKLSAAGSSGDAMDRPSASRQTVMTQNRYLEVALNIEMLS